MIDVIGIRVSGLGSGVSDDFTGMKFEDAHQRPLCLFIFSNHFQAVLLDYRYQALSGHFTESAKVVIFRPFCRVIDGKHCQAVLIGKR